MFVLQRKTKIQIFAVKLVWISQTREYLSKKKMYWGKNFFQLFGDLWCVMDTRAVWVCVWDLQVYVYHTFHRPFHLL